MKIQSRDEFFKKLEDDAKKSKSPVIPVDFNAIEAGNNMESADSPATDMSARGEAAVSENLEDEGALYRTQLEKINDYIQYIMPQMMIRKDLPAWVQDKITKSEEMLEDLDSYYRSLEFAKGSDSVEG